MKLTREELLTQQRLLREALDWVESKLRECDSPESEPPPPLAEPLPPKQVTKTEAAILPDELTKTQPQGLSKGSQVGCIVIVTILVASFLFILFGLPYLIYNDEAPADTEQIQTR
jgi:hypothetical protein